ncbi:MAG: hypothetical protein KBG64_02710 [Clostridia bacterium]|nr:hypothetical protein [Clostridia bacterium]
MLMREKAMLMALCLAFYLPDHLSIYAVVPVLISFSAAALNSRYTKATIQAFIWVVYVALCFVEPDLIYFLPVLSIDLLAGHEAALILISAFPIIWHRSAFGLEELTLPLLFVLLAWLLKSLSLELDQARSAVKETDQERERTLNLLKEKKELLEKKDDDVYLARLSERNRISGEIHDHIGHLLTRAILQLGAVLTLCRDPVVSHLLDGLEITLKDSLDEIRRSVHDLHDTAVDLEVELQSLIHSFTFCPVSLTYDVFIKPDPQTVLAFLSIVREALSNVARHSSATKADVTVREHPGFYQLIIYDNGTAWSGPHQNGPIDPDVLKNLSSGGIGLQNMVRHVRSLSGLIHFKRDNGFLIYVAVPRTIENNKSMHQISYS